MTHFRRERFRGDPFSKRPISELTHCRSELYSEICLFEVVINFEMTLFSEVTYFRTDQFRTEPFFDMIPYPKRAIFRIESFSKLSISKGPIFQSGRNR